MCLIFYLTASKSGKKLAITKIVFKTEYLWQHNGKGSPEKIPGLSYLPPWIRVNGTVIRVHPFKKKHLRLLRISTLTFIINQHIIIVVLVTTCDFDDSRDVLTVSVQTTVVEPVTDTRHTDDEESGFNKIFTCCRRLPRNGFWKCDTGMDENSVKPPKQRNGLKASSYRH